MRQRVFVSASVFWLLASGFWLLASGFWLLASGFWLLASGFWLPSPQARQMPPAVDRHRLAGDPAGGGRHEKCNEIRDFRGRAWPPERMRRTRALEERGIPR